MVDRRSKMAAVGSTVLLLLAIVLSHEVVISRLCLGCAGRSSALKWASSREGGVSVMGRFKRGSEDTILLPPVPRSGECSLEEAIWLRRSIRSYKNKAPAIDVISRLLWAAQGITSDDGLRSAPSAGATYPLELYLATSEYVAQYIPDGHRLVVVMREDIRGPLAEAALGQDCVGSAPLVFIFAADPSRTSVRYGDRAELYVHIEVGCASENLMLQAAALGLGSVPVGAFYDDDVASVLELPEGWAPYLLVPVGMP